MNLFLPDVKLPIMASIKSILITTATGILMATQLSAQTTLGGVNLGHLPDHLFVFTNGSGDANWQGATKGFVGDVAVDGIQASLRTSGGVPYAGTIYTNASSLGAWQSIVDQNSGQAYRSLNQVSKISSLESDLANAFAQINALSPTSGYSNVSSTSLNGLNRQNGVSETFVINITSGLQVSSQINITGDQGDIFILRWDTDGNPNNGYQGQVKFQSGGAIVPKGALKPTNFINVAGDINSSGGGSNPPAPYPQGPRLDDGQGALVDGASNFSGGGFFTGYWLTTGDPSNGQTASQSNGIFVGGWYTSTTKFSMTSGTSGCYVSPPVIGSIGDRVWNDINRNGIQDAGETGVAGIVVTLYDASNNVIASTTTDGYGNYNFSNLDVAPAGGTSYKVRFSLPAGYSYTTQNADGAGVSGINNSDANIATGFTNIITLTTAAPNVKYVDAGINYTKPARIGDFVWNDLNQNGIQDAGEAGIAGVTVMLYNSASNALVAATITSNNGYYFFNDVVPGSYYIKVSQPIGYVFSSKNAGASTVDSDVDPATGKTGTFTVVTGTYDLSFDAGLHVTPATGASGSLGDRVWEDLNNNGLQDAGEPGVDNVTVQLFDGSNVLVATATTDAFGNYIFNGLIPGDYYVKFILPSGFSFCTANAGSDDSIDSDVDGTNGTGTTASVSVAADEINTTLDAGLKRITATASLGDFVWYDLNKNGIQDAGEAGVPGVTATLYNNSNVAVQSTTTNSNGFYLFTGLPASTNFTVGFSNIPAGYGFSPQNGAITVITNSDVNPATGKTGTVTTGSAGTTITFVDAGLVITPNTFDSKSSIGDKVWNDLNNNGIQDSDEPGIATVTVTLYGADGTTVIASTITDAQGNYLFTNLDAGTYIVGFSNLPSNYIFTAQNAGSDSGKDSDPNTTTGKTSPFYLTAGQINLTIDAGARNTNTTLSSLGDFVWYDLNGNGIQDSGEPGAEGVSIALLNSSGVILKTTTTDANGRYRFTDLTTGTYFIQFDNLPAGYSATTKNAIGSTSGNNSDANTSTLATDAISLPASSNDLTWDLGIKTSTRASLGDFVWNDLNGNGIQDAGEPGVAGVTVTILDNTNTPIAQTVTDGNGFYFFSNLLPGTYSVGYTTIPANAVFTVQNAGGSTAANNSDPDASGRTPLFTLMAGQSKTDVDAGLVTLLAAVGDFVWLDVNRNGIQDAGEAPVPGVTVTLYNSSNTPVASAVTDGNGRYFINNIPVAAGGSSFTIGFSDLPVNKVFTIKDAVGSTAENNSDADIVTGITDAFVLNPGQIQLNIDAGIKTLTITGNVWHDVNGMNDNLVNNSGAAQSPPAAGIPVGLRVYLVNVNTGLVEKVSIVASATGKFTFADVNPNTSYRVYLSQVLYPVGTNESTIAPILPTGWIHTGQKNANPPNSTTGSDGINDGRVNVPVGITDVININFGIQVSGGDVVIG